MSEMKAALAEIDDVEAVQAVRDLAMELHATVAILRCRKEEVNRCYEKIESYRNEIADLRQQLNTARGMIPPQEPTMSVPGVGVMPAAIKATKPRRVKIQQGVDLFGGVMISVYENPAEVLIEF